MPNVVNGPVTILNTALAPDFGCDQLAIAKDLCVIGRRLFETGQMTLGNDKHMRRRLRIDVFKDINLIVLVDLLRRNLSLDDFAEEAIVHNEMVDDAANLTPSFSGDAYCRCSFLRASR